MSSKLNRALFAGVVLAVVLPVCAMAQVFQSQGPGPANRTFDAVGSNDEPPDSGTATGAIEAVIADPNNANILYAGSVNGGIWKTTDGGTHWTPLSDHQASLSIASLAFDPTDSSGRTILGGVGISSNGRFATYNGGSIGGRGGDRTGLLLSTDGGQTWSALGTTDLAGQTVAAVAIRGQTILAGTDEIVNRLSPPDSTGDRGLDRSTNGGQSFTVVSGAAARAFRPDR